MFFFLFFSTWCYRVHKDISKKKKQQISYTHSTTKQNHFFPLKKIYIFCFVLANGTFILFSDCDIFCPAILENPYVPDISAWKFLDGFVFEIQKPFGSFVLCRISSTFIDSEFLNTFLNFVCNTFAKIQLEVSFWLQF